MKLNVEPKKKLNTIDELYKDICYKGKHQSAKNDTRPKR